MLQKILEAATTANGGKKLDISKRPFILQFDDGYVTISQEEDAINVDITLCDEAPRVLVIHSDLEDLFDEF